MTGKQNDFSEVNDVLVATQSVVKTALEKLGYSESFYELLKQPLRTLTVRIPVKMDDGTVRVFTGYRAQHNDAVGPTKGGIRFHPLVTQSEVEALSLWMSLKCGIFDLPYGGGKGGVICNPREMSFPEIERLARGYVRAISQIVGPTKDIPAPDVYTDAQTMAWMMDEYSKMKEVNMPGFITGKPTTLGGSLGRASATSMGVAITIREAAKKLGLNVKGMRVIIQGFGNVGSYLAEILHGWGALVVGISDSYGAIYDANGLDVPFLLSKRDSFGTITKYYKTTTTNAALLEMDCDVLIPAAIENQITAENAPRIQAKIVAEGANGPTTVEGTSILAERGILLIPDVLANAGGVTVSYFEWVQNNQGYYWTEVEVQEKLDAMMVKAFHVVYNLANSRQVDMRLAAYMVGVQKMAEAAQLRGWV